jgi:tetratricopeptide (TPR) repeat protein
MNNKLSTRAVRTRLESRIEAALLPGQPLSWRDTGEFIEGLELARNAVMALLPGKAALAAELLEAFLAGCMAKAGEVHLSGDELGDFVQGLAGGWVRARRAAGCAPEDTIRVLLDWEEKDEYAFFHDAESELAGIFNSAERAALIAALRARLDRELPGAGGPGPAGPPSGGDFRARRTADKLKALYECSRNADAFEEVCRATGTSPKDCERIAKILRSRGKALLALEWVEKGLRLQSEDRRGWDAWELRDIKRELLKRLGRREEALQFAWEEFRRHPSEFSFADFMGCVPPPERSAWRAKALEAAETAPLDSCIDLFLKARELPRLAARVARAGEEELEKQSYLRAVPAARKLARGHPAEAAALYRGQAMQILNAKKSGLYGAAVKYFSEARRCYKAAGRPEEWRGLAERVLGAHSRKPAFLARFRPLASGDAAAREPSFLERAKERWKGGGTA